MAISVRSPELEYAERRMQRRWYDLAMAEQYGQPRERLEALFQSYLRATEEYVQLCQRLEQRLVS